MYYLLILLLILISIYVITNVVSMFAKGCVFVVAITITGILVYLAVQSSRSPVNILDTFEMDNFEIRRLK